MGMAHSGRATSETRQKRQSMINNPNASTITVNGSWKIEALTMVIDDCATLVSLMILEINSPTRVLL